MNNNHKSYHRFIRVITIFGITLLFAACQKVEPEHDWLSGDEYERIDTIATHLRGNDVVMWEVDFRHKKLWEAIVAKNNDYGLYQLTKIELSMKHGMERRPKRAESYTWFFDTAIPQMKQALENGDAVEGMKVFTAHCMTCHAMENVAYMPVAMPWLEGSGEAAQTSR